MSDAGLLAGLRALVAEAAAQVPASLPADVRLKAPQDFVTEVDLALDAHLTEGLAWLLPGVPVLSEERAAAAAGPVDAAWIVDPLDGTGNLVAGIPFVAVSVALVDARGPRLAAMAAVREGAMLTAERGRGAWAGDAALRLPASPPDLLALSTGLIDALMAAPDGPERWRRLRAVGKLRNLGAQALHLCAVAQGRLAAAASVEARVWDEAAAGLILREAGGSWRSRADGADWTRPAGLLRLGGLRSLGAHPRVEAALAEALAGLAGGGGG